jgi:hypothetical protein
MSTRPRGQAQRELAKLQVRLEGQSRARNELTEVELARAINFILTRAARGRATPREMATARSIHFALFGTPTIDPEAWGAKEIEPLTQSGQVRRCTSANHRI